MFEENLIKTKINYQIIFLLIQSTVDHEIFNDKFFSTVYSNAENLLTYIILIYYTTTWDLLSSKIF